MADGSMSTAEREDFLSDVHVGVLAISQRAKGPLALPVWYRFRGGEVLIEMDGRSLKARLLREAGRATVTAQSEAPPYKYVSIEGPVVVDDLQPDDLEMATRYLGAEMGKRYDENNPRTENSVVVRLKPERWRTMDFGKLMGG